MSHAFSPAQHTDRDDAPRRGARVYCVGVSACVCVDFTIARRAHSTSSSPPTPLVAMLTFRVRSSVTVDSTLPSVVVVVGKPSRVQFLDTNDGRGFQCCVYVLCFNRPQARLDHGCKRHASQITPALIRALRIAAAAAGDVSVCISATASANTQPPAVR